MRAAVAVMLALALVAVSLASPDRPTTQYFEAGKVSAAFAKGSPLLENGQYKIHASRREQPGMAEVHVRDTDIIHVLEGKALFVVGGTVVDGKTTAQDEVRGSRIELGTEYKLSKGDVFVVPNGTPHWFKEVDGPLLYYVVKVTS
jgi:glc operon protein GlcG